MTASAKISEVGVPAGDGLHGAPLIPPAENLVSAAVSNASRPVDAIVSSHDGVADGEVVAPVQRPSWELGDSEFSGYEEELILRKSDPLPRVVFGGVSTMKEPEEATSELKDVLDNFFRVYLKSPNSTSSDGSLILGQEPGLPILLSNSEFAEAKACVTSETASSKHVLHTLKFIWETPAAQISSDRKKNRLRELQEEVKEILAHVVNPSKQLNLIDHLQRLGVAYHFKKEIEEALQHAYEAHHDYEINNLDDLYNVSLRFRLLRQQGYNISSDIFNKFKDNNGNFSETLIGDTLGMLSLYEVAHLRKHGEDILDEALVFTSYHLQLIETSNPLSSQVNHALKHPIRKSIPRLEAGYYLSIYHEIDSHNKALLELAKIDFNLVQSLHKKELSDISRWWKDLDFATKLPFARDRIVEVYFWIVGVYFEPQYSLGRKIMTKVVAMTSYLDDIYDLYGTLKELELFTNAIERWDIDSMDQLPEYMKYSYQAILDTYKEIEEDMVKEGRSYSVHYAKEAMKRQVNVYLQEAKWCKEEYVPTLEEYISNALLSSVYPLMALTSFLGVEGQLATKEVFDWVFNVPKIVRASSIIGRLLDDIVSHKFEQERGHVASAVECCMKEYGISEEQAYVEIRKRLENEWKDINEECLKPTDQDMPMPLLNLVLNLTSVAEIIYKEGDGYTKVGKEMRARITMMLIDPIPI